MRSYSLYDLPDAAPEAITDPILSDLYAYWIGLRKDGAIPSRSDLDPTDIPKLLPYVILAECYDEGRRIKFRLTGSDIAFTQGADLTGLFLHERGPLTLYLEHLSEIYRLGAISDEGVYSSFSYGYTGDECGPKQVNRIFLPMTGCADTPSMLLVGQVRDRSEPMAKPIWLTEPDLIKPIALFAIRSESAQTKQSSSR